MVAVLSSPTTSSSAFSCVSPTTPHVQERDSNRSFSPKYQLVSWHSTCYTFARYNGGLQDTSRKRTMGRYQQWLYYREIEHDLQAQLETLERELAQLQERSLEHNGQQQETSPQADNPILQALAINL